jgi:hypothetical protein
MAIGITLILRPLALWSDALPSLLDSRLPFNFCDSSFQVPLILARHPVGHLFVPFRWQVDVGSVTA